MVVVLIITRPQSAVIPDHYITKVKALCLSHMLLHINVSLSPWWSLLTPHCVSDQDLVSAQLGADW